MKKVFLISVTLILFLQSGICQNNPANPLLQDRIIKTENVLLPADYEIMDTAFFQQTAEAISIDGVGDELIWQSLPQIPLNKLIEGVIDDHADFSAGFKACWDMNNLYFLIDITDQLLAAPNETTWKNDNVEFYFDMNNSRIIFEEGGHWNAYDEDDSQTRITWDNPDLDGINPLGDLNFVQVAKGTGDGSIMEVAIPWTSTGIPGPGVGMTCGFELMVADNDGGPEREAVLSWHAEENFAWRDPSIFGLAQLTDEDGGLPLEGTAFLMADGYYYPSGHGLWNGVHILNPAGSYSRWIELHNIGSQDLTGLELLGSAPQYFVPGLAVTSLAPGESTDIEVIVNLTQPGYYEIWLTLNSSDSNSPHEINVHTEVRENMRIWVSKTGNDETGEGSEGNPFLTIQRGLDHAMTGDTVYVLPGTYDQSLGIWHKEVVLTSEFLFDGSLNTLETTVINSDEFSSSIYLENAGGSEIIGFVLNGGNTGIVSENSSPVIRNNIIQNCAYDGMNMNGDSYPHIYNNVIANCGDEGIDFSNSHGELINNTLYRTGLDPQPEGSISCAVECGEDSNPVIKNNVMMYPGDHGVFVHGGVPDISYNCVFGFRTSPYEGSSSLGGGIEDNPLLYMPMEGDYSLQSGSPCIDAGDPDPAFQDADASRNDMGAFGGPWGIPYSYEDGPPQVELRMEEYQQVIAGEEVQLKIYVWDAQTAVSSVEAAIYLSDWTFSESVTMFDDGLNGDDAAGDGIYGVLWTTPPGQVETYHLEFIVEDDMGHGGRQAEDVVVETYTPVVWYVDQSNNTGVEDGSQANPFNTIMEALALAGQNDSVRVAEGTYVENLEHNDISIVLEGGYTNGDWSRNPVHHLTIIDGDGIAPVLRLHFASVVVDGFTIQNGYNDSYGGAGINAEGGNPIIRNCVIWTNQGTGPDEWGAGGICFNEGHLLVENCIIANNDSPQGACGLRAGGCTVKVMNTLIADNTGTVAIHFNEVDAELYNVTVVSNEGGYGLGDGNVLVKNCIEWDNNQNNWGSLNQVTYSCFEGWVEENEGIIHDDPLFVDLVGGDFRLSDASPCVNAGAYDSDMLGLPDTDMDGSPRFFGGRIDMGTYENQSVSLPSVDLEVLEWVEPLDDCDLGGEEFITIRIRNIGLNPQDDYVLSFSNDDGNTFVTEHVTQVINPGDILEYTFSNGADFSAAMIYGCMAAVSASGDANTGNDSLELDVYGRHDLSVSDYSTSFEWDDLNSGRWISEDNDEDGSSWEIWQWNANTGRNSYVCYGADQDDWLFSHCFWLESSKTYGIAFHYKAYQELPGMMLEVMAGTDPSSGAMTMDLLSFNELTNTDYKYAIASLSVPQDGVYYLGWHKLSEGEEYNALILDDVAVFEMDAYDISLQDARIVSEYTIAPLAHVQEISYGADLLNRGYNDVTGVLLELEVNGGLFSTSNTVDILLQGEDTNLNLPGSFLPGEPGTYDAVFTASINEAEEDLSNNSDSRQFVVSDSVYARDNGNLISNVAHNGGGTLGPVFELLAPDVITSVSMYLSAANEGEQFSFSVFDNWLIPEDDIGNLLFTTDTFVVDPQMIGQWVTFNLSEDGIALSPGNFVVAINTIGSNRISIGTDGNPDGYFVAGDTNGWQRLEWGNIMIRANFGSTPCDLPDEWSVNPADYEFSGQITAKVILYDVPAESGYLAAFAGDECRSMPAEAGYFEPGDHFVFEMICFSNTAEGEELTFKYFDVNACEILEPFAELVPFEADMTVGDAMLPFEIHYPGTIQFDRSFTTGWNWFSVNVVGEDMTLGNVLSCALDDDYIKNQVASATYYETFGWYGSLETLNPVELYKIKVTDPCGVSILGTPVDVTNTPIPLVAGWNWIGYLPQVDIPITEALGSLTLESDDYIKNQVSSSTYYDAYGWYGSLEDLHPGEGYMFKKTSADELIYPEGPAEPAIQKASPASASPSSSFNPHHFEFTGSLTASVLMDGSPSGEKGDLILAFVDDQCRGVSEARYFSPRELHAFPMMVYSNMAEGEELSFKYYDASTRITYPCVETLLFEEDMVVADVYHSLELNVNSALGVKDNPAGSLALEAWPNPFTDRIRITYTVAEPLKVRIAVYDMLGKVVEILDERTASPGTSSLEWDATRQPEGNYILKLTAGDKSLMERVVLIR